MPANAGMFFRTIMSIAAFDFYDFTDIIHNLFNLEPTEPIDNNFESIGFESQYFLINMGTMACFFLIYIVVLLIVLACLPFSKRRCRRIKRLERKVKSKVFWSSLITLLNESYVILAVCLIINAQILSLESTGLAVMSILCVTFLVLQILLPIFFIGKLYWNFDRLKDPQIEQGYGVIYEELRIKTGKKILFIPSSFLVRRVMLAIAVCIVGKVLIWQVFILVGQVVAQIILIGENVYMKSSKSKIEYFNEVIILCVLYTILTFSPWVSDLDVKFYVGYWTISFIVIHLAVNMLLILKSTFRTLKLRCRKRIMKKGLKKHRKNIQSKLD